MGALKEYLVPYLISNIISLLCLRAVFKKSILARFFLTLFFLWAAFLNSTLSFISPEDYLTYGDLSFVQWYKDFITGFFAQHIRLFVLTIAAGQFFIFLGLVLRGNWAKLACIGGIIFGLAIAPFGVGSAFPCTIIMALAFFILLKKYRHDFIWKWRQYASY